MQDLKYDHIPKMIQKLVFDCVGYAANFFCLHSRLVLAQWSLAPDKKFAQPPCQIPNF